MSKSGGGGSGTGRAGRHRPRAGDFLSHVERRVFPGGCFFAAAMLIGTNLAFPLFGDPGILERARVGCASGCAQRRGHTRPRLTGAGYSTVTVFARLRGLSTSRPRRVAIE
jgi:hypothetical protein